MAQFIAPVAPDLGGNGPHRHILVEPDGQRPVADHRGPLRILMIGEPSLVRETITQIHLGHYRVDLRLWSPFLAIPETGLVIPRYPGQILAFLQKPEHLNPRQSPQPPNPPEP